MSPEITPPPTDEEAVAIVAAMQSLWPNTVTVADETKARETTWRFSGRWWSRPLPSRRDRPHR